MRDFRDSRGLKQSHDDSARVSWTGCLFLHRGLCAHNLYGCRRDQSSLPMYIEFIDGVAVMAAVVFLDEDFSYINGIGLIVLIAGVALFNFTKYQRLISGEAHIVTPTILRKDSETILGSKGLMDSGKEGSGDEEDLEVSLTTLLRPSCRMRMVCISAFCGLACWSYEWCGCVNFVCPSRAMCKGESCLHTLNRERK